MTSQLGEFEVREQQGPAGYYGKVSLEIEPDDSSRGVAIDFDERDAKDWREAARFGCLYALEHVSKKSFPSSGLRIHVRKIKGYPFDTNNLIIAYAAACALLKALGRSGSEFISIDTEQGTIAFSR